MEVIMGKIATNSDVNSKVGSSLSPDAKCPTKTEIQNTGKASISGIYSNVQCVQSVDISKPVFRLTFRGEMMTDNYWISQKSTPPTSAGTSWLLYSGGQTAILSEGTGIGDKGSESFAFGKNIYVRRNNGNSYTVPASQVVAGGSYTVG